MGRAERTGRRGRAEVAGRGGAGFCLGASHGATSGRRGLHRLPPAALLSGAAVGAGAAAGPRLRGPARRPPAAGRGPTPIPGSCGARGLSLPGWAQRAAGGGGRGEEGAGRRAGGRGRRGAGRASPEGPRSADEGTRSSGSRPGQLRDAAAAEMLQTLYDYFWWERLWLPVNLTWADLEDRDGRVYAKASDLYITLPLALLFLIIRYFFELYVATPLASLLNVKEKTRLRAPPNPTLEHFYLTSGKQPKQVEVELLSRQSGFSGRQVERWFRRRRNQDRPSLLKKFREAR